MNKMLVKVFIIIIPLSFFGQSNDTLNFTKKISPDTSVNIAKEEYLTIVFTDFFINSQKVFISINGEDYKKLTVRSKGRYNFNELIKIIKDFNEKGWSLKTSNIAFGENSNDYLFVLMTRKKEKIKSSSLTN